jgi:hypothetical protein
LAVCQARGQVQAGRVGLGGQAAGLAQRVFDAGRRREIVCTGPADFTRYFDPHR